MIEDSIYNILSVALFANYFTHFYKPIQPAREALVNFLSYFFIITKVLSCSKCLSFILSLIVFLDIRAALLAGFLGYIIQFLIDYISEWYE